MIDINDMSDEELLKEKKKLESQLIRAGTKKDLGNGLVIRYVENKDGSIFARIEKEEN